MISSWMVLKTERKNQFAVQCEVDEGPYVLLLPTIWHLCLRREHHDIGLVQLGFNQNHSIMKKKRKEKKSHEEKWIRVYKDASIIVEWEADRKHWSFISQLRWLLLVITHLVINLTVFLCIYCIYICNNFFWRESLIEYSDLSQL